METLNGHSLRPLMGKLQTSVPNYVRYAASLISLHALSMGIASFSPVHNSLPIIQYHSLKISFFFYQPVCHLVDPLAIAFCSSDSLAVSLSKSILHCTPQ